MKLPTIWTNEKHSQEEAEPGRNSHVEKVRREKIRDGESQKSQDAGARKGREVATHSVFPIFCGSGRSKGRVAKATGAETSGQMRHEKLHAVVARSTFWSKKCQNTSGLRPAFGQLRCGKKCTPLWREAHLEVKSAKTRQLRTPFWKLSCGKSARRCGREAHLEVKMYKAHHVRTTFGSWDVEKVHAVVDLRCFDTFYFKMCFAPTTASTFSTSQRLKGLRSWGVL